MTKPFLIRVTAAFFLLTASLNIIAQQSTRPALTAEDYARAEKFMGYNTMTLVSGTGIRPNWIAGDRFWYRNQTAQGTTEFVLINPADGSRQTFPDQEKLNAAIGVT